MFFRALVFIILIYLLYRFVKSIIQNNKLSSKSVSPSISSRVAGEDLVEDPACHTYIPLSQAYIGEISGREYYFCSKKCYDKYILEKRG